MKRVSLPNIIRIFICILALLNIGVFPLRASNSGNIDKSIVIPNDFLQNASIQKNDGTAQYRAGMHKKPVNFLSVTLLMSVCGITCPETYRENYINSLITYFIHFRTFTTYPIPPPAC